MTWVKANRTKPQHSIQHNFCDELVITDHCYIFTLSFHLDSYLYTNSIFVYFFYQWTHSWNVMLPWLLRKLSPHVGFSFVELLMTSIISHFSTLLLQNILRAVIGWATSKSWRDHGWDLFEPPEGGCKFIGLHHLCGFIRNTYRKVLCDIVILNHCGVIVLFF